MERDTSPFQMEFLVMSDPHIGMKADEVLKMKGRSVDDAVRDPTPLFDPTGEILQVTWHYADCDVVLAHDGKCYRVRELVRHGLDTDVTLQERL